MFPPAVDRIPCPALRRNRPLEPAEEASGAPVHFSPSPGMKAHPSEAGRQTHHPGRAERIKGEHRAWPNVDPTRG